MELSLRSIHQPLKFRDDWFYQSLWKIEESFRVLKTNLEARPIFVWRPESIQGHFVLCFLALVLQRFLEHRLKSKGVPLSTERIQQALKSATLSL